jgi:hypothetical protein
VGWAMTSSYSHASRVLIPDPSSRSNSERTSPAHPTCTPISVAFLSDADARLRMVRRPSGPVLVEYSADQCDRHYSGGRSCHLQYKSCVVRSLSHGERNRDANEHTSGSDGQRCFRTLQYSTVQCVCPFKRQSHNEPDLGHRVDKIEKAALAGSNAYYISSPKCFYREHSNPLRGPP